MHDAYLYPPPPYPPARRARHGGVWALVVMTLASVLAAPHAQALRPQVQALRSMLASGFADGFADGRPTLHMPERATPARQPPRLPSGLVFTDAAGCRPARDWASPRLDRRVRTLLTRVAARHRIRVTCLRSGHSRYVAGTRRVSNHTVWRAVDIDRVDGRPVRVGNPVARQLAAWIGRGGAGVHPSEVGSPWGFGRRPWFTDARHQDHVHVGFGAAQ